MDEGEIEIIRESEACLTPWGTLTEEFERKQSAVPSQFPLLEIAIDSAHKELKRGRIHAIYDVTTKEISHGGAEPHQVTVHRCWKDFATFRNVLHSSSPWLLIPFPNKTDDDLNVRVHVSVPASWPFAPPYVVPMLSDDPDSHGSLARVEAESRLEEQQAHMHIHPAQLSPLSALWPVIPHETSNVDGRGRLNVAVIDNRRHALRVFLAYAVAHPHVRNSHVLREFLGLEPLRVRSDERLDLKAELLSLEAQTLAGRMAGHIAPDKTFEPKWERLNRMNDAYRSLNALRRHIRLHEAQATDVLQELTGELEGLVKWEESNAPQSAIRDISIPTAIIECKRRADVLSGMSNRQLAADSGVLGEFFKRHFRIAESYRDAEEYRYMVELRRNIAALPVENKKHEIEVAQQGRHVKGASGLAEVVEEHVASLLQHDAGGKVHVEHILRLEEQLHELQAKAEEASRSYQHFCVLLNDELRRLDEIRGTDLVTSIKSYANAQQEYHNDCGLIWEQIVPYTAVF